MSNIRKGVLFALAVVLLVFTFAPNAVSQGTYTAELRGQVTDNTGAMLPHATVTITADETGLSQTATTDDAGRYIFTALRPTTYTLRVQAKGFATSVHKNIVLAVNQQASMTFELKPAAANESVDVVDTAPLLDTGGASLGTEVTNEFISRMPIQNRDVTQLVYLSAGVTTLNNGGGYPYGTDFSSNGQRYGSAEFRLDGGLATGPEQGEGATTNVSYVPSTEVIQEFKVQNNSFAAEFGSNGGTVVNVLMKSGTNKFHGSGWWFGQRTELNANDFFSNRAGVPRTDNTRDQFGGALSGPIYKNKTFFLVDVEHVRQNNKNLISGRVPTDLERAGNFSETMVQDDNGNLVPVQLFNPFAYDPVTQTRQPFVGNVIPAGMITAIGQNLVNAYPAATGPIDPGTQTNFNVATVITSPNTQFDIKIDHQWNDRIHLMGRYSQANSEFDQPGAFYDGITSNTTTRNVVLEGTWTISPTLLWTNRAGLDRYYQKGTSQKVDLTTLGLPTLYMDANGIQRMPSMPVDNYSGLNDQQCCVDTVNGHTQYVFASQMSWIHGKHSFKYGWEGRIFLNNFYQPDYATGLFNFTKTITAEDPFGGSPANYGTGLAGMLLGFPQSGQINIKYGVADKSMQNAFYFQDDWKVTPKLSLSLGLRYEFSTPYTERHNRSQFDNFTGDSGVSLNLNPTGDPDLATLGLGTTDLKGTTVFATSNNRHVPSDLNNWGPRLGFAYQLAQNTVLRGGVGMFYGLSTATNFQYSGTSFRKDAAIHFTNDGGVTQYATLDNPFPTLPTNTVPGPQGTTYGKLAEWGFADSNDLGTLPDRNPEIYQWNIGVQHLLPWGIVISADYSANHSTHLPYGYPTRNRDFLSAAARQKVIALANAKGEAPSDLLNELYPNPFQSMFVGPTATFHEPDSIYNNDTIPLVNLLKPYPQFDGDFEGLPLTSANSWYNGLLVRFQKRPSHGLSFEGSYTYSHATDNSSYGANSWIFFNGSGLGQPQDLNNLKAEYSIGANDTPQRFTLATVYDLPFGRTRTFGGDMNRWVDGFVGGWSVNALLTLQSGQPIPFAMSNSQLWDGQQRPNLSCNPLSGMSLHDVAMSNDPNANYFNASCFADPGDQVPGNAPRFSSDARGQGIKNLDLGVFKDFAIHENMKLELRAEFFNFTNSVRFATPFSAWGDGSFGRVESQANQPRHMQVAIRFEF
ncbi:Cna B-type protein [Candidatus Koribacter versatilis Ellin345]|uniref:Cna B-type protein n=1 Tax=Koribacter versatilis (strain Ellin345) TaxID=204669 RepID=Q1IT64_KORVE|nr:TonB-dependent receptor [Candidatus Koribacter versatilis]ABF39936.1 Cna B-type protein [Candidatus Koribacter versatilis Ellin345]